MTVLKEQICPKYSGSTDGRTREEEEEKEEEQETHVFFFFRPLFALRSSRVKPLSIPFRSGACVSQILAEVQDLGHLDSAHTAPICRVETSSL